ncbi:MAG: septum formation initiator family protein [Christensenellaceae bacterium]|jgi:cell division protein FtsB|nr:septum formation initiator family protein [Christensenellaceae bacterium]
MANTMQGQARETARRTKHKKLRLAVFASLVCVAMVGMVLYSQQHKLRVIAAEQAELALQLQDRQTEKRRLEYMIEYAQSEEYLLQFAREKLGYVKPGDVKFDIGE